ncbi:MAG: Gfo/Idh/MocA family oxidoreductase [Candidatus Latescibacteria bacterium]|nr:Gfo/Idh/MocA family oxidoreductase [Candidatus Latescibacterota bacterium]
MSKKYRVAVVGGAGTWGRNYLRAYAAHPDCQIVALVDRAKDRRQEFADHYGITTVFDDLEDLLAREVPDVVSVILPVAANPAAVMACARAGVKAVSCEKPIAVSLAEADAMVDTCRQHGTALACGTAHWEVHALLDTAAWVQAGNIGALKAASIPGGLPNEVSGGGCVQLTMLRALTGREVEWVEGWELPPAPGWKVPPGGDERDVDCPAYGRLGLAGGLVCHIPQPREVRCRVWVEGEAGQVWLSPPCPVLIQGLGPDSAPVYPEFLHAPEPGDLFLPVIERLLRAHDRGGEAQCSGHDYRQALEIAIALKRSAREGNRRIHLPLEDRSQLIYPHPYRLRGGDVAGWASIGYTGPPKVEG